MGKWLYGKKRTEIRQDSEGCANRIIYMIIIGFYIGEKEPDIYIHKKSVSIFVRAVDDLQRADTHFCALNVGCFVIDGKRSTEVI